jgi:Fe-S oxidoreductase
VSPVGATYGGIPGYVIFWGLFALALGLFLQRVLFLYRLVRLGKQENRFDRTGERIGGTLVEVVLQRCNLKSFTRGDRAGIGHAVIFWSFCVVLFGYFVFIGLAGGFGLAPLIAQTPFETAYASVLDVVAVGLTLALVVAAIRRYVQRPQRLEPSAEAGIILILIFSLAVLHVLGDAFDLAARGVHASWPPLGAALAGFLGRTDLSQGALEAGYRGVWWLHYLVILGFLVYIPRSKHLHILASPFNTYFRSLGPKLALEPLPVEEQQSFGVSRIGDFTWKDLLDLYACAVCGRCQVNCPAQLSGKSLSPKEFIGNLKEHLLATGPGLLESRTESPSGGPETPAEAPLQSLIGDVVSEEEIWACTTCGACQEVCPVSIEHVRKIIDLRRNLVLTQEKMPETARIMLRNMQSRGHPWAGIQSLRLRGDWTGGLEVKVLEEGDGANTLFWVGCTGALVARNVAATLSMARLLKAAGVEFAVLGEAEACCGDPARRAGYEFQFQIMAEENIESLKRHNVREIITSCPHCYHTLKNEYPRYGGDFTVVHYTQLVAALMRQGRLTLAHGLDSTVTYHDPCYLGRYNGVYQEPRQVLRAIPGVKMKEMERSRSTSLCCGGGGGHMWIEEQPGTTKISQLRVEDVRKTGARTVVTACPYCLQMFEESIEHLEMKNSLKARDLAEVVEAAMTQPQPG